MSGCLTSRSSGAPTAIRQARLLAPAWLASYDWHTMFADRSPPSGSLLDGV
jgi:hypothetical protein